MADIEKGVPIRLFDEANQAYSGSNPLPVSFEESEGAEVHDYNESVDVAALGTANHDYSVANGDTFLLEQVLAECSTRFKVEIQVGDGAASEVFSTVAVRLNSEKQGGAGGADTAFVRPVKVVGTVNTTTVRVKVDNLDKNDAASIYTTIVGLTQA